MLLPSQKDDFKPVRPERTGWRDAKLRERHRQWGFNLPAVDIDLFLEYDNGTPAGLIEYKAESAMPMNGGNPSRKALRKLADSAKVPFFGVRYSQDLTMYYVVPGNEYAKQYVPEPALFNEQIYVELLYRIRKRTPPAKIAQEM